jgi:hypothetical protein
MQMFIQRLIKKRPDWYYSPVWRAPRDVASWERVLTFLSLMWSQISNRSVCVIAFRINEEKEQWVCFRVWQYLGKHAQKRMITVAFGEDSMNSTQVFEWFCSFKEGWTSVESNRRSRWLLRSRNSEMIDKGCALLKSGRRLTIIETFEEGRIWIELCHAIVTRSGHETNGSEVHPRCWQPNRRKIACVQLLAFFSVQNQIQTL